MRGNRIKTLAPPDAPEAGAHTIAHIIRTALETALLSAPGSLERSLAALALVAPDACLDVIADCPAELERSVPSRDISNAIIVAFGNLGADAPQRRQHAARIARRYGDRLTRDAVLAVLGALGESAATEDDILERSVRRFPAEPAILRAAIEAVRAREDEPRLDELLTALGAADRTPATVAFVHRLRPAREPAGRAEVRAALLSSFTIDPLVPYLDLACRALDLIPHTYVAPFNSWTRDVIDHASGLRRFEPDIVFLSVSIDDLLPHLDRDLDAAELDAGAESALERVLEAARAFASWSGGRPLVVHAFHSAFASPLGIADGRERPSRSEWLARLNAKLAESLRALPACYMLDVATALSASGASLSDNPKLRQMASLRLPAHALGSLADAYVRYIAPLRGLTRKCVVLDLDNTLWGGVVGEDGLAGLRLGSTSPGSEFVEFQHYLRSLTERGILLAINSKNNPADALEAIEKHEAMVLREADFSAIRINWESKTDNMRAIAAELNIGLDALVFVDDNPDERERMRQLLPEVLTVDLPRDAALYRSTLERLPQLQTLNVTPDDRARLESYRTLRHRNAAKSAATDVDAYLRSLDLAVRIAAASPAVAARSVQLFSKTNQFNTTTRRYDAADVARFCVDPSARLWVLHSKDRFGDHGLVALALVRVDSAVWTIDSFLMSCRVIGYGIESALLAFVAERARAAGATTLVAEFVPTKKNAPAQDLFARHGFSRTGDCGATQRWDFALASELAFPAWIERSHDDA